MEKLSALWILHLNFQQIVLAKLVLQVLNGANAPAGGGGKRRDVSVKPLMPFHLLLPKLVKSQGALSKAHGDGLR